MYSSENRINNECKIHTGHSLIMVIFEDSRYISTYCRAFGCGAVTTCFYDLGLLRLGFEHPTFRLRGIRSNPLSTLL